MIAKIDIDLIFAISTIDVWNERLYARECTLQECEEAMRSCANT